MSNYITKSDKNAVGIYASKFAEKVDLVFLKSDIDKLETTIVDLSQLCDVVESEVVKKSVYSKIVKNVNAIQANDTSNGVKKADYDTKIKVEDKICKHGKYMTINDFNKFSGIIFDEKLKQVKLAKLRVEFNRSYLKQDKVTFTPRNVVLNLFFVYELDPRSHDLGHDFTLKDCLFGLVKLTKMAYPNN